MPFMGTNFDILELYAGRARITRLARACGYAAIATDKVYDPESKCSLQLNGHAGFALPTSINACMHVYSMLA